MQAVGPGLMAAGRLEKGLMIFVGCLGAVASIGCGPRHQSPNSGPASPPIAANVYTPYPLQSYSTQDPNCQAASGSAPVAITGASLHGWLDSSVQPLAAAFHSTVSNSSLTSAAISQTTYSDVYQRDCDASFLQSQSCPGPDGQEKGWTQYSSNPPAKLRVCAADGTFDRLSYEGIALEAAYFVQQAHDHYVTLTAGTGAKAPNAIALRVLPQFITKVDGAQVNGETVQEQLFLVHNLAYFPVGQMIAVFPERADWAKYLTGYFWESEFVLAHEYGHHIDFTRHGEVLNNIGLRWNPVRHGYDDLEALEQSGSAISPKGQVAGAMAEGFADMMAFYEGGANSRTLKGIPDIGYNRDITKDAFNNGDVKALTPQHLDQLLGVLAQADAQPGGPVYNDIHIGGAIVAHTADHIFTLLTAANSQLSPGSPAEVNQRYLLTLAFMDEMVRQMSALNIVDSTAVADTDLIAPLTVAFTKVANDYLGSFQLTGGTTADGVRTSVCDAAKVGLPALATLPFGNGQGC